MLEGLTCFKFKTAPNLLIVQFSEEGAIDSLLIILVEIPVLPPANALFSDVFRIFFFFLGEVEKPLQNY